MKKGCLIKGSIIAVALLCILGFAAFMGWRVMSDYNRALNANWGFKVPWQSQYSEIYKTDSGPSFHGDGLRYHVYSYKYEDFIDLMFAWRPVERETNYYDSYSEAVTEWLNDLEVPEEYCPEFANCSYWYRTKNDKSEIICLWDAGMNRLYIAESFL